MFLNLVLEAQNRVTHQHKETLNLLFFKNVVHLLRMWIRQSREESGQYCFIYHHTMLVGVNVSNHTFKVRHIIHRHRDVFMEVIGGSIWNRQGESIKQYAICYGGHLSNPHTSKETKMVQKKKETKLAMFEFKVDRAFHINSLGWYSVVTSTI